MQSPSSHYVIDPFCYWIMNYTNVDKLLSANMSSILGLISALISARMIMDDKLIVRQIGALVFCFELFFDSLDGELAEREHGISTGNGNIYELEKNI